MNILNIFSIICLALCLIMFFYFRWYIKKSVSSSSVSAKELTVRQREVENLIADIDRITDRDSQLVEARIKHLKILIEETDKRISLYVKELEKGGSGESLYSSLGKGIRDALNISKQETDANTASHEEARLPVPVDTIELSPEAKLESLRTFSASSVASHVTSLETPVISKQEEAVLSASHPNKQQLRSHIDLLLNEGLPPEEIASRLGISVAEVNLAINLRRNRGNIAK